jgi:hypothetical protein
VVVRFFWFALIIEYWWRLVKARNMSSRSFHLWILNALLFGCSLVYGGPVVKVLHGSEERRMEYMIDELAKLPVAIGTEEPRDVSLEPVKIGVEEDGGEPPAPVKIGVEKGGEEPPAQVKIGTESDGAVPPAPVITIDEEDGEQIPEPIGRPA